MKINESIKTHCFNNDCSGRGSLETFLRFLGVFDYAALSFFDVLKYTSSGVFFFKDEWGIPLL